MQMLWELPNGINVLLVCLSELWGQALLLHVFQLVAQRYIDCSMSVSALMINMFDHFFLCQVYAQNLVTEDTLVSQVAKWTDTSLASSLVNLVIGGSKQLQWESIIDLSRVLITRHLRVVSNVLSLLVITSAYLQIKWLVLLVIFHFGSASCGNACGIDTLRWALHLA